MDLNDTICSCLGITNGMIKDAVDSGARTLEEVQEITEVGTICGACLDDVQQLIDELVKEK
ncbi:(2Fe-2S)-binding protein [Clostridium sp. chh4-2]|uniref:(2Fe-2S)-binding protein n=1 Tax=Clostridium sp. chh4-2 TaxID=2067550 RepID=UPI000CCE48E3|nr:(2Fe-2S)-binding protein [Clostridium sp. chh4-2]PNV63313.1 (2Fe-2S)-binding protein [Clostridium sp. chh4-2]